MDWSMLAAVAELVAAVAVVLSLVYVARQIRQNTVALRSQVNQSLARNSLDLSLELSRPPLASVVVKAASEVGGPVAEVGAEYGLDPVETVQIVGYFTASLRQLENRYRQVELGLLDTTALEQLGGRAGYYRWPVFQSLWPFMRPGVPTDFAEFVERHYEIGQVVTKKLPDAAT